MTTLSIISLVIAVVAFCMAIVLFIMFKNKGEIFAQLIKSHNTNAGVLDALSKSIASTNDDVKKLADLLAKVTSLVQGLSTGKKPTNTKVKKPANTEVKTHLTPKKSTKQSD